MSFFVNNKKIEILLFSLVCTLVIFALNKNSNLSHTSFKNLPFYLRYLDSDEYVENRCNKTAKNFMEKYNITASSKEDINLTKYQKILKEVIENKDCSKIKEYIPRILIYFIFIIIDILFIILWFVFCGCCCCCGKSHKLTAGGCAKLLFFLFCFFSVIAILISVIGGLISPKTYKSINGVFCSFYKLVYHFIDGTNNEVPNSNWKGLNGINTLIQIYDKTQENIKSLPKKDSFGNECFTDDAKKYCYIYNYIFDKLANENEQTNFMKDIEDAKETINSISKVFLNIKNETIYDIEDKMEYLDKYYKLGLLLLFAAIIVFCIFSLLTLSGYFCCKCNCISCLFHIFWNIEMLLIIISLLIGVVFGIIGVVSKDVISLLKYAKSEENLIKEKKPFLLDIDENYRKQINECFNRNGDLSYIFTSTETYNSDIEEYSNSFKGNYSEFKKEESFKSKTKLAKAYESMNEVIINLEELNDNLSPSNLNAIFNCEFVKTDFEVLTGELNDSLSKKLTLFSLVIIVIDLAMFVSILFGLLFVINYKGEDGLEEIKSHERQGKSHSRDTKNNNDISSDNLRGAK